MELIDRCELISLLKTRADICYYNYKHAKSLIEKTENLEQHVNYVKFISIVESIQIVDRKEIFKWEFKIPFRRKK